MRVLSPPLFLFLVLAKHTENERNEVKISEKILSFSIKCKGSFAKNHEGQLLRTESSLERPNVILFSLWNGEFFLMFTWVTVRFSKCIFRRVMCLNCYGVMRESYNNANFNKSK